MLTPTTRRTEPALDAGVLAEMAIRSDVAMAVLADLHEPAAQAVASSARDVPALLAEVRRQAVALHRAEAALEMIRRNAQHVLETLGIFKKGGR